MPEKMKDTDTKPSVVPKKTPGVTVRGSGVGFTKELKKEAVVGHDLTTTELKKKVEAAQKTHEELADKMAQKNKGIFGRLHDWVVDHPFKAGGACVGAGVVGVGMQRLALWMAEGIPHGADALYGAVNVATPAAATPAVYLFIAGYLVVYTAAAALVAVVAVAGLGRLERWLDSRPAKGEA